MKTPKNLLNHARFNNILKHTQYLEKLNSMLEPCLPNDCIGHVHVANAIPPTLILNVANAGLATNLRFRANEILERIRFLTNYTQFSQLKIKVTPESFTPAPVGRPPRPLSQESIETMQSLSDCVTNPELKIALEKFGKE